MSAPRLRERLQARARAFAAIRSFFAARNVIEVATPAMSPTAATDPALVNVSCEVAALGGRQFLQTSPEHAMKRLLAAGSGDIWQLARVFRDGELGRWHQPEFLLLEWYRTGFDDFALMDEVFELLQSLAAAVPKQLGRLDLSYAQAIGAVFAVDVHRLDESGQRKLRQQLASADIDVPPELGPDALLDLALACCIVPRWPRETAVFLYDYPATQAALAALKPGDPTVAARFEVFINGVEIGNGFHELTDAAEQGARFEADLAARRRAGLPAVPVDEALLAALETGLPACAGVAIGLDRLLAVLADADRVAAVMDWPHRSPTNQ
jgi:lysyl-tRNA synthetase class 2